MKTVTAKMFISFIGILVVAPFFAFALIVGARAVAVSQGAQDDLLLVALALAGAAASVINGMGRRTERERTIAINKSKPTDHRLGRDVSTIHLGY